MTDKETARKLCKQYKLSFNHALYHKDGSWYHHLVRFPGALLDKDGYVMFSTKQQYESCRYLYLGEEIVVRNGKSIKSIPGYKLFPDLSNLSFKKQNVNPSGNTTSGTTTFSTEFSEGGTREIALEIQRRNPRLREMALKHYGTICQVCGFDFGKTYGAIGDGFIEVHHIKPLSLSNIRTIVTLEDVAVVCSNCHRILHRNGIRPMSIKELSALLKEKRAL
jgi:hypothetical protein